MHRPIHGTVHGKTIELDEDLGLVDGQEVAVRVEAIGRLQTWGDGILRSAGGWADYAGLDAVFKQIEQERKLERNEAKSG
ncbi:MAG TPA: hypothetical protein VG713_08765 [Pirellulales bacterium]|nr:hypothetical protein [Pirellulales bacterium]